VTLIELIQYLVDASELVPGATMDADRAMLLAAGQAMFSLFNENAFLMSYVIVSTGWLMISCVMLQSRTFGRLTGVCGNIEER
jgi:hypothetical protein